MNKFKENDLVIINSVNFPHLIGKSGIVKNIACNGFIHIKLNDNYDNNYFFLPENLELRNDLKIFL